MIGKSESKAAGRPTSHGLPPLRFMVSTEAVEPFQLVTLIQPALIQSVPAR